MPILYGALLSPFVRKVHITLALKKIAHDVEEITPFIAEHKQKLLTLSPLGKIPIYQDEEVTLADSSVICAYLDKRYPTPSLYPADPVEYGKCLWYEEYADTELTPAIARVFFNTMVASKFNLPIDANIIAKGLETDLPPTFTYLNGALTNRNYLVGEQLSIADVSVIGSLMTFQLTGHNIDVNYWPHLAHYYHQHINQASTITHIYQYIKKISEERLGRK